MESTTDTCKVTVVIIGKNEEQFIGGGIEAALAATDPLPSREIIFVDSASTDRSIEVAQAYPIRILQLRPDWPLCVAAGRYTGYLHSHGEYVLFIDGDAEADSEWLARSIAWLDKHPDYGAVAGVLDEVYMTQDGTVVGGADNVFDQDLNAAVQDTKALGGIALYRRAALEQAGTVNPHLPTGEDDEVCMRIRNAGFKLARLEGRMAVKYTEKRESLYEVFRRCRTKMYDYGAVIRYSAMYGKGWQYSREMIPYVLSFFATLGLLIIAVPVAVAFNFLGWLALGLAILFLLLVIKKRSFKAVLISIAVRAVSSYRTLVSFLTTKTKQVDAYPTDVIVVQ